MTDAIETHLNRLLDARAYPKTICPSEVARALSAGELRQLDAGDWRDAMPAIRDIVFERRREGLVEVLQRGEVLGDDIEVEGIRGPIRVRKTSKS